MNRIGSKIRGSGVAFPQHPQHPVTKAGGFLDARALSNRRRHFGPGNGYRNLVTGINDSREDQFSPEISAKRQRLPNLYQRTPSNPPTTNSFDCAQGSLWTLGTQ